MTEPADARRDTKQKLLVERTHNALDSLESSLRALAPPDQDHPIDLVLQLRREGNQAVPRHTAWQTMTR